MRYTILAIIILCSCGPAYHLRRANYHLRKAVDKGATITPDTIYHEVEVLTVERQLDTLVHYVNLTDTVTVTKDNVITKVKVDTVEKTVFVDTICPPDTLKIEVPVAVTEEIKSGFTRFQMILVFLAGVGGGGLVFLLSRLRSR